MKTGRVVGVGLKKIVLLLQLFSIGPVVVAFEDRHITPGACGQGAMKLGAMPRFLGRGRMRKFSPKRAAQFAAIFGVASDEQSSAITTS